MSSADLGSVVANPGGFRWMDPMATALARAGLLRLYMTPVAISDGQRRLLDRLPGPLAAENTLQRRSLPALVDRTMARRAATFPELLHVLSGRIPALHPINPRLRDWRSRTFDRAVGRRLRHGDTAVIASRASALETLRAARRLGIPSFLDYATPHHRTESAILSEEARLKPEFAPTLQHLVPNPRLERQLDEELQLADHVFALSSFHRRSFIDAGVEESKLTLTPLGVDLDLFQPLPSPGDGRFRVLFVGQLTQRKGLSYLLDAFERAGIPDSELLLHGRVIFTSQPWADRPGVRYVPLIPRHELPALYASCDLIVLPSVLESFGQTPLEAMACGRPVIVSENTFAGDVIEDGVNGFIVPIRDPDAIAERLSFLRQRPDEARRMGEAARKRAEGFSWRHYGDLIVEAVSGQGPKPPVTTGTG